MKNFKTRILSADYGKRFRLLLAAGLCILVIGGGASTVLLHTLDADALAGPSQMQQNFNSQPPGNLPNQSGNDQQPGSMPQNGGSGDQSFHHGHGSMGGGGMDGNPGGPMGGPRDGRGGNHGHFLSMILHNSQVSIATKITVLATTILGILWLLAVWYTIVCYLYRSATFSRMNRTLWTVLGIFGSVFALLAFYIARSILKVRCATCDTWQDADQAYCMECGSSLQQKCTACGTSVSQNAAYCPSCGKNMKADSGTNA